MVNSTSSMQAAQKARNHQLPQTFSQKPSAPIGHNITPHDAADVGPLVSNASRSMSAPISTDRLDQAVPLNSPAKISLGNEAYKQAFQQAVLLVKQVLAGADSDDTKTALQDYARAGKDVKGLVNRFVEQNKQASRSSTLFSLVAPIAAAKYQFDKANA